MRNSRFVMFMLTFLFEIMMSIQAFAGVTYTIDPYNTWTDVTTSNDKRRYDGGFVQCSPGVIQMKAWQEGTQIYFKIRKEGGTSTFKYTCKYEIYRQGETTPTVKGSIPAGSTESAKIPLTPNYSNLKKGYYAVLYSPTADGGTYYHTQLIFIQVTGTPAEAALELDGQLKILYNGTSVTSLEVGKSYTFETYIYNDGDADWSGDFWFKTSDGRDILSIGSQSVKAKARKLISKTFTPSFSYSGSAKLWHRATNYSGSGTVLASGSYYANSMSLTITEKSEPQKLATPRYDTFSASDITSTSFTAKWGAVEKATSYNIYVSKTKGDFTVKEFSKQGISGTSCSVTGLQPGTDYYFQVQACASGMTSSDWSKSSQTPVTTTAAEAALELDGQLKILYNGTSVTSLEVGKSYTFETYIYNDGDADWSGDFWFKTSDGRDILSIGSQSVKAKARKLISKTFTPSFSYSGSAKLWHRASNYSGSGTVLASGSYYANSMSLTITEKTEPQKLATPRFDTFSASDITSTSFTAKWGAVEKATSYNIYVSKTKGDFTVKEFSKQGISGTSCSVTGLQPGTDYYFQVQACASGMTSSDWSKSSQTPVTTTSLPITAGGLEMAGTMWFEYNGSQVTVLEAGKNYTFHASVRNKGSEAWTGDFWLKTSDGRDILSIGSQTISKGSTRGMTKSYTPDITYTGAATLYYRASGSTAHGAEVPGTTFYSNSMQVTIKGGTADSKLSAPSNLRATDVQAGGVTLNWDKVKDATQYDINLIEVDKSYNFDKCLVNKGTMSNYCIITGLEPGKTYKYRIRAKNANTGQSSDWSYSQSNVTTKKAVAENEYCEAANLTLKQECGFGTDVLVVGRTYTFTSYVSTSDNSWSGYVFLKDATETGSNNIGQWKLTLGKNTGIQPITCTYTPTKVGDVSFDVKYQTDNVGKGRYFNSGELSSTFRVKVVEDVSVYNGLKLSSTTVPVNSREYRKTDVDATVFNAGTKEWSGKLMLAIDGVTYKTVTRTMGMGASYKLAASWTPQTSGLHVMEVFYRTDACDETFRIGEAEEIIIEEEESHSLNPEKIIVTLVSEGLAPETVTQGSIVNYFYRITDTDYNPISSAKVAFTCTTSSGGSDIVETSLSDDKGLAMLSINAWDDMSKYKVGDLLTLKIQNAQISNGLMTKPLTVTNPDAKDNTIKLRIRSNSIYNTAEKIEAELNVGVKGDVNLGIFKASGEVRVPLTLGFKYDDSHNVSNIEVGIGLSGAGGVKSNWENKVSGLSGVFETLSKFKFSANVEAGGFIKAKPKNLADLGQHLVYAVANNIDYSDDDESLINMRSIKQFLDEKFGKPESELKWEKGIYIGAKASLGYSIPLPDMKEIGSKYLPKSLLPPQNSYFSATGGSADVKANVKATFTKSSDGLQSWTSEMSAGISGEKELDVQFFPKRVWNAYCLAKGEGLGFDDKKFDKFYGTDYDVKANAELSGSLKETTSFENGEISQMSWDLGLKGKASISLSDKLNTLFSKVNKVQASYTTGYKMKLSSSGPIAKRMYNNPETFSCIYPSLEGKYFIAPWKDIYKIATEEHLIQGVMEKNFPYVKYSEPIYALKESLKMSTSCSHAIEGGVEFNLSKTWLWSVTFAGSLKLSCDNYPSESYYSFTDHKFLPVVMHESTSILSIAEGAMDCVNDAFQSAFDEKDQNDIQTIKDAEIQKRKQKNDNAQNHSFDFPRIGASPIAKQYLSHRLANVIQKDISSFSLQIDKDRLVFDDDTEFEFSNYYPGGMLFGLSDTQDTLFVVSDVIKFNATHAGQRLAKAPNGKFTLTAHVGVDDLTPFGLSENTFVDVYHHSEGSNVWHLVGPAGANLKLDELGTYMMATSVRNDLIAPELSVELDEESALVYINVSDNMATRNESLRVYINGALRDVTALNHSTFIVELSPEEVKTLYTVYANICDLAGNVGEISRIFNIEAYMTGIDDVASDADADSVKMTAHNQQIDIENAEPGNVAMVFAVNGTIVGRAIVGANGSATVNLQNVRPGVYVVSLSNGVVRKIVIE